MKYDKYLFLFCETFHRIRALVLEVGLEKAYKAFI